MVEGGLYKVSVSLPSYKRQLVCYGAGMHALCNGTLVILIATRLDIINGYYNIVHTQEFGIVEMSIDYIYTPVS